MKWISRISAILLFILFFSFALKNTDEVVLHLFLQYKLRGPLVLMLLGCFLGGAVLGIVAMIPTVMRQRRELNQCKSHLAAMQKTESERQRPKALLQPDMMSNP
jgi:uncharacterized integral membrane protein